MSEPTLKPQVMEWVAKIPRGKVVSYGEIGRHIGATGWTVGIVLTGMTSEEMEQYSWQRVVAKNGFISAIKLGFKGELQKKLLLEEGVEVVDDAVDMSRFGYFFGDDLFE